MTQYRWTFKQAGKYELILADPPWQYRDAANDGKRGAEHKYPVMKLADIKRLPVHLLAADNCLLAMWHVGPMPDDALQVVRAWGFRLMNMKGFTWHKIHEKSGKDCMGMGHLTRGNSEDILFAVKGKLPKRVMANIIQMVNSPASHVIAPRGEHSAKPKVFHDKLVELLGEVPRIELFARDRYPGWHHWGNECDSDVLMVMPAAHVMSEPPEAWYDDI